MVRRGCLLCDQASAGVAYFSVLSQLRAIEPVLEKTFIFAECGLFGLTEDARIFGDPRTSAGVLSVEAHAKKKATTGPHFGKGTSQT